VCRDAQRTRGVLAGRQRGEDLEAGARDVLDIRSVVSAGVTPRRASARQPYQHEHPR
jgi:hypothetical protein